MYVNRPLVKLSGSRTQNNSVLSKLTSSPPTKQSSPNSLERFQQEQEGHELDTLELLYSMEYKLEKLAGTVSSNLENFEAVTVNQGDQDSLTKSRQLIEAAIRKQIKRELDVLEQNENRRMRLQATTYQTHLDINEFRRQIEQLKKDNEDIKLAIAAGKERQQSIVEAQKQLSIALANKGKLTDRYRSGQQKLYKSREQLSTMDSQHFSLQQQLEEVRLEQEMYADNSKNIREREELERYKLRLSEQISKKEANYQRNYEQRVEEATEITRNINKVDELLQGVIAQIYEQKCFIRAGEEEKYRDPSFLQEPLPSTRRTRRTDKEKLTKHYEQLYLPELDEKWRGMRPRYSDYLQHDKKKFLDESTSNLKLSRHLKRYHTHGPNEESEREKRPYRQSLSPSRNNVPMKKHTLKLTAPPKKRASQLDNLYNQNSEQLKSKITAHIKRKQNPKQVPDSEGVQLVSVNDDENDSNYEYVEMDLTKEQLQQMAHRNKK